MKKAEVKTPTFNADSNKDREKEMNFKKYLTFKISAIVFIIYQIILAL